MVHSSVISSFVVQKWLYKIEEKEYKYPYQVYKVPVQAHFLNHQVMTPAFKHPSPGHQCNNDIDYHPGEHVKTVEAGDGKK
jgi:hypothetical protein